MKFNKIAVIFFVSVTLFFFSCKTSDKIVSQFPTLPIALYPEPARPPGQSDVLELRTDPIDTVRVAFIGLGRRGAGSVYRFTFIEGAKVAVLCDVVPENLEIAQQHLRDRGLPEAETYSGENDWKEICKRNDIDLIYISTHWQLHTPIAVYAMQQGKHVAIEVPAAQTIEESWQLVNTAEKTQRHCMMLENCNYDFFEMATLNMAQHGLFGEITHAEGAYIHDLRELLFDTATGYWNMWRLKENEKRDGNLYPTHGIGPVCHVLNIHRGDKMNSLVSVSSNQFGLSEYAKQKFGADSEFRSKSYKKGDINTTIIKTEKGKTILLQHDVTSPRPYSRLHTISGTKGFAQKYPNKGLAFEPTAHHFLSQEETEAMLAKYEHPIVREIGEKAKEVGGHGGMDFIMDYRLIYCLRHGLPLDQDVYDAAEWSAIIELTEKSAANHGVPLKIPDFTRGSWNKVDGVKYFHK